MKDGKRHITVLVSNDLQHDQRVAKVCETLLNLGYDITLVGRLMKGSQSFERPYEIKRFSLPFDKGALFYASLNIRLCFYLLFKRTHVILANDLDTLLPAFLIARLLGREIVYDSHEYFTEAEGLTGRPFQKNTWLLIERFIFPKLKHVFTVNESIAGFYRSKYHTHVRVVRNVPFLSSEMPNASREQLGLPPDKKIILLQGAYIDPDRGGMELAEAMTYLDDVILLIIGAGRDLENIRKKITALKIEDKVILKPKMPFEELRRYSACVDLGLSLDKPVHLNYTYSLPNKLFDYIHAGIPVLVSDLPELRRVVTDWKIGMIADEIEPEKLAGAIQQALHHPDYAAWKQNCMLAKKELNWQKESLILKEVYEHI